jgi:hypothetical protein
MGKEYCCKSSSLNYQKNVQKERQWHGESNIAVLELQGDGCDSWAMGIMP